MMNGGHRETEKLTMRSKATVAAFEKASTAWVDGGGGWREKTRRSEGESEQIEVKSRNWRYLRLRGNTTKLMGASASRFGHRSSGLRGGGG